MTLSPIPSVEAYTIDRFAQAFGLGRTSVYEAIKAGKLRAVKCGMRTLILARDAEAWAASLPPLKPSAPVAA